MGRSATESPEKPFFLFLLLITTKLATNLLPLYLVQSKNTGRNVKTGGEVAYSLIND